MADISVVVNNLQYSGWESLQITRSLDYLCGNFSFTLANFPFESTKALVPGVPAIIFFGGQRLITGYLDAARRSRSGNSTQLDFSGRDRTSDLVDCSAIYKTNSWKRTSLLKIASDLCLPYGISVSLVGVPDSVVAEFALQTGETPFAAVERLCRVYGILPMTDMFGNLMLTTVQSSRANVPLVVGQNVLTVSYEEDDSGRYSEYLVKGQARGQGGGWLEDRIDLKGSARDAGVDRYRPLVIVAERHMTAQDIAKRASWEAQVRMGRGSRVSVTVMGWSQDTRFPDEASRPWALNELVNIRDASWGIDANLLVSSVTFDLSSGSGRLTTLGLSPPEVYSRDPSDRVQLSRRSSVRPE